MEKIKHLDIEFEYVNYFSFKTRVFELTKGNNLDLLIDLFNDIGYDFSTKLEKTLSKNGIESFKNDINIKLINRIRDNLFDKFQINGENLDYVPNDDYTFEQYCDYIKNIPYVVFDYGYFAFDINHKLQREDEFIRYKFSEETKEIQDLREHFGTVLDYLSDIIYAEYRKIKIDDNEEQPEPLDLSDTLAVEKIIYLNELGIIDFLRTKTKAGISNSSLASVLSGITGIKAETIKPSLNRLSNNDTIDNKHPYYTTKTVEKIKTFLIKLGF